MRQSCWMTSKGPFQLELFYEYEYQITFVKCPRSLELQKEQTWGQKCDPKSTKTPGRLSRNKRKIWSFQVFRQEQKCLLCISGEDRTQWNGVLSVSVWRKGKMASRSLSQTTPSHVLLLDSKVCGNKTCAYCFITSNTHFSLKVSCYTWYSNNKEQTMSWKWGKASKESVKKGQCF